MSSSETENQGSCSLATNSKPCHSMSQLGLAREAVDNNWVSLPEKGCWIVKGSDGSTPNVVTLHPKETCSCAATKSCYHIMACKLMLGQNAADIEDSTKPNASLLHRTNRRKNKEDLLAESNLEEMTLTTTRNLEVYTCLKFYWDE